MQKEVRFPEPEERQGVRETYVGPYSLPKKARSNQFTRGRWSFRLAGGNAYAYWQEFYHDKIQYYHILNIEDEDLLEVLDYWDLMEERGTRRNWDNISFSQLNYARKLDEDGSALDPEDQEIYREWVREEENATDCKLPIKAEHAIVHSIVEQLSPADQRIYQYMFSDNMSSAEIKQAFDLTASALSEEKIRFLEKVRKVFIELGYDVPTLEELQEENNRHQDAMKEIAKAKKEEAESSRLGKSISSELRRSESTTKPRAFATEEQEKEDRLNGVDEPEGIGRLDTAEENVDGFV